MMNGKEYLESLNDGRVVYLNGKKIEDVTTHPAYQNSARSIKRMYDSLHDPEKASILTTKNRRGIRNPEVFLKRLRVPRNC